MLCLAGMFLYTNPAAATPFPDKTDQVIQDEDNYLDAKDKASLAESLAGMPGSYKIVVVESTSPETQSADEYAQKLYDNYNLAEDAMMIVLDMNTEELGVYAGAELQEKGATMEMLHEKIASYYNPFRNQKEYVNGIETFLIETNAELERLGNQANSAPADAAQESAAASAESTSLWGGIPWWVYAIGAVFAALSIILIYAMIRRRSIFAQVDEVEDWKDELVEKIHGIEVEKPLRRSSGKTEVRYHQLADKKENLLRIRIPDVEMMILDAEEACDRFRFSLAVGILEEAREALKQIEQELADLKTDTSQVAVAKQESKLVIPEIGKQVEQVERRLSDMRLEYGLSFHELKAALDEVETMRSLIKTARAAGDDVQAYETTMKAQKRLEQLTKALDLVPSLVERVKRELPREFKQLEEGIDQAVRDGFDLTMDGLDNALLQAKQLLSAANTALEEGSLETVNTHVKAFEVLVENTYQGLEATILANRQAAAAASVPEKAPLSLTGTAYAEAPQPQPQAVFDEPEREAQTANETPAAADEQPIAVRPADEEVTSLPEQLSDDAWRPAEAAAPGLHADDESRQEWKKAGRSEDERDRAGLNSEAMTQAERDVLLWGQEGKYAARSSAADGGEGPLAEAGPEEDEEEYELVIPKQAENVQEEYVEEKAERLVIETEDDALDELERISNTLVRLRQQIKRSYLPGVPDQLKYMFEEMVLTLSRIKAMMEKYRYDLEEVAILLQDASDLLAETEQMTERIISTCQMAEGAIQYTNRYRRQNRQVNELLNQAEQSFRQLAFAEAYQLAEEARLLIEGPPQEAEATGWLLRRKKKG